ncbi:hypothetical protein JOB18_032347 [Solea senegalensis]|uniref:Uncharacterized protein n=1 Tax=Solea senegalensis TaxID=28829 RepID=A0AAV6PI86_SOLSE|nr:hypothetical protein JOB18_032347 [Solea senegalensis]
MGIRAKEAQSGTKSPDNILALLGPYSELMESWNKSSTSIRKPPAITQITSKKPRQHKSNRCPHSGFPSASETVTVCSCYVHGGRKCELVLDGSSVIIHCSPLRVNVQNKAEWQRYKTNQAGFTRSGSPLKLARQHVKPKQA